MSVGDGDTVAAGAGVAVGAGVGDGEMTQPATTHAAMIIDSRKINMVRFIISLRVYPVDQ